MQNEHRPERAFIPQLGFAEFFNIIYQIAKKWFIFSAIFTLYLLFVFPPTSLPTGLIVASGVFIVTTTVGLATELAIRAVFGIIGYSCRRLFRPLFGTYENNADRHEDEDGRRPLDAKSDDFDPEIVNINDLLSIKSKKVNINMDIRNTADTADLCDELNGISLGVFIEDPKEIPFSVAGARDALFLQADDNTATPPQPPIDKKQLKERNTI